MGTADRHGFRNGRPAVKGEPEVIVSRPSLIGIGRQTGAFGSVDGHFLAVASQRPLRLSI